MHSQLSDSLGDLLLKVQFLEILLSMIYCDHLFAMVTVLCFLVMCYEFVIDIESTATET